ncbi:hypothetical protein GWK47_024704 [Chionoecetes opilio]|uniref:Uncharacterized protein n=1 Tax=Chionoecetes opilio TaxID=41210 RepID=A0A8J4XKV7_CHIOP|nr:hypothetical protein GWK47_024704 [Chionoecetes opilio]
MFHILETRPTKVRWCWLARGRSTFTTSPLVSTVLVLHVATLGGWRNPARCGTPCTCALWNTTSAVTSLRCSSESRGLAGLGCAGGSAASTNRRAAHDIQERAAYSNCLPMFKRLCQSYQRTARRTTLRSWSTASCACLAT